MMIWVLVRAVPSNAQTIEELAPFPDSVSALAPHPFGELHAGALTVAPTLSLREVGYDTNVFDLSGVERQPGDFTATIEPGVGVDVTTGSLAIRTLTRAAFIYYQTYKTEQAINPVVDLRVNQRLSSRLGLYAIGSYGYSKMRAGYEIDSRERTLSQATTAGLRTGGRKLRFDLHGAYSTVSYDPNAKFFNMDLARTMNHTAVGGGIGAAYSLSPYTSVTAAADEEFHRFPLDPTRDTNQTTTFVGLRFSPRAVIAGDAAIGYTRATPLVSLAPPFSGITPRAGLTYKMHDVFSLGVGAERSIENSFYGDRPYYVLTVYEASTTVAILGRFDIGGSLQYATLDYRYFLDAAVQNGPPDLVRMETVTVGAPVKKGVHAGVFVQRWRRISNELPYESTRIGFEMTIGPASISPRGIFFTGPLR